MIPAFDRETGALPPGDHQATLEEIAKRLQFTPRRRWLLKGLRVAVEAFWAAGIAAGIKEIFIDGSFCAEKADPGDIDGYWVEPDADVLRTDRSLLDRLRTGTVPHVRKLKWRMLADHVSSSSSIPRCKQLRKRDFRSSFGMIAMGIREA